MFTLTISDKPVAVTNANEEEARELFMSDDFKEDLKSLTAEGRPLWDGTSPLTIRAATPEEIEAFDEALDDEEYEDEDPTDDDDDPIDVVFLVEVDDDDEEDDSASA